MGDVLAGFLTVLGDRKVDPVLSRLTGLYRELVGN
jgi:hypothetical protein